MNNFMSYQEMVQFIERKLNTDGPQAELTRMELEYYRNSLAGDPLLQTLMSHYLPYGKKWESIIWRAAHRFPPPSPRRRAQVEVHDPALAGPRIRAKKFLEECYPHNIPKEQQQAEAVAVLREIEIAIASGEYDQILIAQEKDRQIILAREAAERKHQIDYKPFLKPGATIEQIKENFAHYFKKLYHEIPSQTACVQEILSLKKWADAAPGEETDLKTPLQNKRDRISAIVEALDESRTAYFAGGDFQGQKYSCPLGAAERFLDRAFLIMEAQAHKNPMTPEEKLLPAFIHPFVTQDLQTKTFIPSNTLYEHYLRAAGYERRTLIQHRYCLAFEPESPQYEQKKAEYVAKHMAIIKDNFDKSQTLKKGYEAIKSRADTQPYLDKSSADPSTKDQERLVGDRELQELLVSNFEEKIAQTCRLYQEDDYRPFDPDLFTVIEEERQTIEDVGMGGDTAQELSERRDELIIKRLADSIGFGVEHVKTLLSIIGQSRSYSHMGDLSRFGGLEFLESCVQAELPVLRADLPAAMSAEEEQRWFSEAHNLYAAYLEQYPTRYAGQPPVVRFLPTHADARGMIAEIKNQVLKNNPPFVAPSILQSLYENHQISFGPECANNSTLHENILALGLVTLYADVRHLFTGNNNTWPCSVTLRHGQTEMFKFLIENHCDERLYHAPNNALLNLTIEAAQPDMVEFLLSRPDYRYHSDHFQDGLSSLAIALDSGSTEIVQLLLNDRRTTMVLEDLRERDRASNIIAKDIVCRAVSNRYIKVLEVVLKDLLQKNALDFTKSKRVPYRLYEAINFCISHDFYHELEVLLQAQEKSFQRMGVENLQHSMADLLSWSKRDGAKPLMFAITHKSPKCASILIQHGARIDSSYPDALSFAIKSGELDLVKLFLPQITYQSLEARDASGNTPFLHAAEQNSTELLDYLVSSYNKLLQQANKNAARKIAEGLSMKNHQGKNALMIAIQAQNLSMIRFLIDHGASLTDKVCDGRTENMNLLMIAAKTGNMMIFNMLKENLPPELYQEMLKERDSDGASVAHYSVTSSVQMPILQQIIEDHCDPTACASNLILRTPLEYACFHKNIEAVRFLLSIESVLAQLKTEKHQETACLFSTRGPRTCHKRYEITRLLLQHGARFIPKMLDSGRRAGPEMEDVFLTAIRNDDFNKMLDLIDDGFEVTQEVRKCAVAHGQADTLQLVLSGKISDEELDDLAAMTDRSRTPALYRIISESKREKPVEETTSGYTRRKWHDIKYLR